jgi:CrcB protein
MLYLVVFVGAGIGGMLRHGVNTAAMRLAGPNFPYGTLTVNLVGSALMGLIVGYFAFRGGSGIFGAMSQHWRLFLTTGVLGGFTTFSAFSLDFATLWERSPAPSILYAAVSVGGSIAVIFAALAVARVLWAS